LWRKFQITGVQNIFLKWSTLVIQNNEQVFERKFCCSFKFATTPPPLLLGESPVGVPVQLHLQDVEASAKPGHSNNNRFD
jgi:hypothetical protein